jgi:hypothetical protein
MYQDSLFAGHPRMEKKSGADYFVTGNLTVDDTGEYPGVCEIAGVITTDRFLQ